MKAVLGCILLLSVSFGVYAYDIQQGADTMEGRRWMFRAALQGVANPSTFILPLELRYRLPLTALQNQGKSFRYAHARFAFLSSLSLGYTDIRLSTVIAPISFLELGATIAFRGHYSIANMGYREIDDVSHNYTQPVGSGSEQAGMYYTFNMLLQGDISFVHLENNTSFTVYHYTPFLSNQAAEFFLDTNPTVYLPFSQTDWSISNETLVLFTVTKMFAVGIHNVLKAAPATGRLSDRLHAVGTFEIPLTRSNTLWFYGKLFAGFFAYDQYFNLRVTAFFDCGILLYF